MRWVGNVAHMEGIRNSYATLAGKSEGKKPHGEPIRTRIILKRVLT
jgi:hypothetical protein